MDLDELRSFLAVVDTGSFLSASERTNVPRATLRRRVDSLESRVGRPLLQRTRQGVVVTGAGRVLAAKGRLIMQDVGSLVASLKDDIAAPAGCVTIMLPVGVPPHLVPVMAALAKQHYPDVSVRIRFTDDPVRAALDDVDVLVYLGEEEPPGFWETCGVLRVPAQLVASAAYLEREGTPTSLADLERHTLCAWQPRRGAPFRLPLRAGGELEITPRVVMNDVHLLRQIAGAGVAIAYGPAANFAVPNPAFEELVPVLPELVGRELSLRLVVRSIVAEVPRNQVVVESLVRFMKSVMRGVSPQ